MGASLHSLLELGALAVALVSWIVVMLWQARIKREMKQYGKESRFESLGKKLPDGFVFRGTGLNDPEIANVMKGTLHGSEIVVFTATFWTQDGNRIVVRTQTVVAFPNVHRLGSRQIPSATGNPNLYLEVAGDWLVVYYRAHVVKKDDLAAWCEKMYGIMQRLTSTALAAQRAAG